MLRNKVFGAFESDLEFRLVHLAMSPLYSEAFDANAALRSCLDNVYNAKSHSESFLIIPVYIDLNFELVSHIGIVDDLYSEKEKYFDYRQDLPRIKAKTLVIVGDKDWICPPGMRYDFPLHPRHQTRADFLPENSKFIATKIPQAELFVVKNANHSVHLEKNDEVIARIRDFLEN